MEAEWRASWEEPRINKTSVYRQVIGDAPSCEGVALSRRMAELSVGEACRSRLLSAIEGVRARGADVGFVMFDEETGVVLAMNADTEFFGASAVKAMWVTYLFQEQFETGLVEWDCYLDAYIRLAIARSSNQSYKELRSNYGSESGFKGWLAQAGVGYLGLWDCYTPREQALVWTHMLAYLESGGTYVEAWKSAFGQSVKSFMREALGGGRTIYSKPGWMDKRAHCSCIFNDAAIVIGDGDRRYLLSIMSTMDPFEDYSPLCNLASTLDAVQRAVR